MTTIQATIILLSFIAGTPFGVWAALGRAPSPWFRVPLALFGGCGTGALIALTVPAAASLVGA